MLIFPKKSMDKIIYICADLLLLPQEAFADQITFRNLRRRPLHSKPGFESPLEFNSSGSSKPKPCAHIESDQMDNILLPPSTIPNITLNHSKYIFLQTKSNQFALTPSWTPFPRF